MNEIRSSGKRREVKDRREGKDLIKRNKSRTKAVSEKNCVEKLKEVEKVW